VSSLLLKLVVGHLAGDFLLQGDRDAANKRTPSVLARHTLVHAAILTVIAVTQPFREAGEWLVLGLLLVSHAGIDAITVRAFASSPRRLLVDQTAHLVAIGIAVQVLAPGELREALASALPVLQARDSWWFAGGLVTAVWVGGVVVGTAVAPYAARLSEMGSGREGLERAGRTIGKCERALIYLFIMTGHEALVGFVVAAKALMRLPEARDRGTRGASEYYIVGTLLSLVWAVAAGLMTRALLGR